MASDSNPTADRKELSSHFRQTVCLQDWWLIKSEKVFQGKRLAVAGVSSTEQRAVRVFSSAPIIKRYDVFTLETADGITVVIKGFINKQRTTENGFPLEVFNHFLFGFPPHWEQYAEKCFQGNSTGDFVSRSTASVSRSTHDLEKLMMGSKNMYSMISEVNISTPCKSGMGRLYTAPTNPVSRTCKSSKNLNDSQKDNLAPKCYMKHKNNEGFSPFEVHENQDEENLMRSSLTANADSGKTTDILKESPCQSKSRVLKCQSRRLNRKCEEGQVSEIESRTKTKRFICGPVGSEPVKDTVANIRLEIGEESIPDLSKFGFQELHNVTVQELDGGCHDRGGKRVSNLSKFGLQEPQNVTLEELDDRCLKDGSQQNSELPLTYTDAKCRQSHENVMIQAGRQSKNTNESFKLSTEAGKAKKKKKLKTPVRERASSSARKTKRKLDYNIQANHPSIKKRMKVSIDSPDLSNFKRSRSGRLLIPCLDFWRNQIPVYDVDRRITGIQGGQHLSKSSRGSGSKPRRKQGKVK